MRALSVVLLALAGVLSLASIGFYVWINGLACGYAVQSGACRIKPPWALAGEDFLLLVAMPATAVAVLLAGAAAARLRGRRK